MKDLNVKNTVMNAQKEAYVKPTMEVIEMEVEDVILAGAGSDTRGGGSWGNEAYLLDSKSNSWEGNV